MWRKANLKLRKTLISNLKHPEHMPVSGKGLSGYCRQAGDQGAAEQQAKALYFSRHTRFIDKIVIMKNGEILKVYGRK